MESALYVKKKWGTLYEEWGQAQLNEYLGSIFCEGLPQHCYRCGNCLIFSNSLLQSPYAFADDHRITVEMSCGRFEWKVG